MVYHIYHITDHHRSYDDDRILHITYTDCRTPRMYRVYGVWYHTTSIRYLYVCTVRMYVQVVSVSQTDSFFCLILLLLFLLACDIFCDLRHPDAKPGTSYVNLYYLFKSQPRARPCLQQQSQ